MRSKKLVHVLYSGLGGHSSVVFSLLEADKEKKYDHELIFYGIEPLLEDYKLKCEELGLKYYCIRKKPGLDIRSLNNFYGKLKLIRPSVIFLHSTVLILPAFLYSVFNQTRLIGIEHTPNKIKSVKDWMFTLLAYFLSACLVMLTEEYFYEVKKKYRFIRRKKIRIIPNGINTIRFRPSGMDQNRDHLKIGMVSRFTPGKDHATLIKAFRKVSEDHPTVQLHLAGDGETMGSIIQLVKELSLTDKVEFTGLLGEEELIGFFQDLDIYVHSTHGEAMSTAMLQAFASGLPVIATDVKGVRNLTENGGGILVKENDIEDLYQQIESLIGQADRRISMGRISRQFAEEKLSNHIMFRKYSDLV